MLWPTEPTPKLAQESARTPTRRAPTANEPDERQAFRRLKYKRRPIAREWALLRKRITAVIACINTMLVGLIAGIYAGEVPKIQYQLADLHHRVILGNVVFFLGVGLSTLFTWPLPLLHGRKPYTLVALALTLPLQFPQAIAVTQTRANEARWYVALLLPRAFSGLALGMAHVNCIAILLDLFGASLQSNHPHQEVVDFDDIRRQGGGLGLWLGFWAWCFVASLAIGFLIGAGVTANLDPAWGFYFVVILLAIFLLMNVVAPETRRAPHRRSILHYFDEEDNLQKKVAKGEIMLHLNQDGPKHWWQEVWAGIRLMLSMLSQVGFCVLALYLAWIYALVVLVTLLLGALLSTDYQWLPQYVGLGVFALAIGALLSIPLSKANIFSRERRQPPRTDSMTFQPRVTWSSHLVRRCIFTFALPIAGLAFTLTSPGPSLSWTAPIIMSAIVGFLSTLAIAECIGLTMETYDTCDLQPGVNSKHRLQSLDSVVRRRRTNYSSFPRVIAGLFAAQAFGFFLAAGATSISGSVTRRLGAQAATGVVAGILLLLTIFLSIVLWRFKTVQVIPNHAFGSKKGSKEWTADNDDSYWKPVIVGNPSGKIRRMNLLETGKWSRWTEIRRLNKLVRPGTWEAQ
ncbi:MFS general substrate transporter [Myriangium duriaei CBS 260.36]|uniref:MFS general substrate transporter n=1 Tax=Myriangium duriaei CBS 260.36 TaxID=1168546 RepID=A0A9P4IVJ7_9PEZI|nr:MFS general substrate transporter [Myriangium duriaei CBS 260.36]